MTRDLTDKQFKAAMIRNGFKPELFGYWRILGTETSIFPRNGGPRKRDQLAWALEQKRKKVENNT